MKTYAILFTDPALSDMVEIRDYIKDVLKSNAAAKQTINTIEKAVASLSKMPERRTEVKDEDIAALGIRSIPAGNYIIFFRINDDVVTIIRVLYNKRNWRDLL